MWLPLLPRSETESKRCRGEFEENAGKPSRWVMFALALRPIGASGGGPATAPAFVRGFPGRQAGPACGWKGELFAGLVLSSLQWAQARGSQSSAALVCRGGVSATTGARGSKVATTLFSWSACVSLAASCFLVSQRKPLRRQTESRTPLSRTLGPPNLGAVQGRARLQPDSSHLLPLRRFCLIGRRRWSRSGRGHLASGEEVGPNRSSGEEPVAAFDARPAGEEHADCVAASVVGDADE